MRKTCENCYWLNSDKDRCMVLNKTLENYNICDDFSEICECGEEVKYRYEGKSYCENCILEKFEVDTMEITEYYDSNGEYLGNSESDFDSIIKMLSDNIEILED